MTDSRLSRWAGHAQHKSLPRRGGARRCPLRLQWRSSPDQTPTTSATNRTAGATQDAEGRYESAQDIVDALNQAGFTVSGPQKNDEASYVTEVGGSAYEFTVTDSAEHAAPDSAGINMFPNAEALRQPGPQAAALPRRSRRC
ncbi:hypothetical protein OG616_36145 [Streptomyces antibioticus]|uniref:hypothetical protein n=1 Tax=Streptomyces antibioticus TaxID=1890 RepID=UPI002252F137|nr:hypothetical protein [Streptomyces antibioticus]MCX5173437.1 hypothetical protein [Streptomyces antibioticus]